MTKEKATTERSITVGAQTYRLKDRIPLADYRQWAECNPMQLDTGLVGLNAVLAIPLSLAELDALLDEEYFGLHRAVFDFFLGLRWGRNEP